MVDSEDRKPASGERIDDVDPSDRIIDAEVSIGDSSSGDTEAVNVNRAVTRRLTEVFAEDGDGDLLLQMSDREDGVLQWLRALDMQVIGACRADERLKPLLKLNTSTDMAEDPLLTHLSQHFEAAEVGMLARCLCIPLVSIRVGKINKQGTHLLPLSIRGNLCLTLLPTSDLRVSFNGDDDSVERLATLSTEAQCNGVEIEDITADKSGRSFLMKISDVVFYFWCSEKSKLLGAELRRKMKDLLIKKPSLAELTGISDSRLSCFATHFRAYLAGSMVTNTQTSATPPTSLSDNSIVCSESPFPQSSSGCQTSTSFQQYSSQEENCVNQGNPCPSLSSLKEGLPKGLFVTSAMDKFSSLGENCAVSGDLCVNTSEYGSDESDFSYHQKDKLPELSGNSLAIFNFLDILDKSTELPCAGPEIQTSSSGLSPFSPHYCWCPPVASAMQSTIGNLQLPVPSTESSPLPPLSSLISSGRSSSILLTSKPLLNLADLPPIDFPSLPPEPLVRMPVSQQIPSYTPLMCDPIVHLPVIDVCSSGQAYLVSGGPAMSTVIPPLNPNVVDPLLPKTTESIVEKSARETLRMLLSSSNQANQPLQVLPSVLLSNDKENIILAGSRGLYVGTTQGIDAVSSGMSTMELILSAASDGAVAGKRCIPRENLMDQKEKARNNDHPSEFDE